MTDPGEPKAVRVASEVAPGVWIVGDEMHIDLPVFVRASGGNPRSPEDQATALNVIRGIAEDEGIPLSGA